MRWLTNPYNPNLPDAKMYVAIMHYENQNEASMGYKSWLEGEVIGRPQATKTYSVKQLEDAGYVGIYASPILEGDDAKNFVQHILDNE